MAVKTARRLRELRERLDMTQVELAAQSGVTTAYISRIETGERPNIGGDVLIRLAEALQTSTDYLLGQTDDPRTIHQILDATGLDMRTAHIVRQVERLPQPYRKFAKDQIAAIIDSFFDALESGVLKDA
jgi:transcriptional regulator with XRE-family HTH domain